VSWCSYHYKSAATAAKGGTAILYQTPRIWVTHQTAVLVTHARGLSYHLDYGSSRWTHSFYERGGCGLLVAVVEFVVVGGVLRKNGECKRERKQGRKWQPFMTGLSLLPVRCSKWAVQRQQNCTSSVRCELENTTELEDFIFVICTIPTPISPDLLPSWSDLPTVRRLNQSIW